MSGNELVRQTSRRKSVMPDEPYNPSPVGNPSVLARRNWWQTMLVKFIGKHTPKCREMVRILSRSRFRSGRSMDFIAAGQASRHNHSAEAPAQFCLGRRGWKNTLPLCAERTLSYEAEHRRHSAVMT